MTNIKPVTAVEVGEKVNYHGAIVEVVKRKFYQHNTVVVLNCNVIKGGEDLPKWAFYWEQNTGKYNRSKVSIQGTKLHEVEIK